ncbi:MAG: GntR family transcriptional regulator [Rhizobiales bacterium]|nr:GntR family transcriptional regulator [Hyphomicrobiales bacterium]
MTIKKTDFIAEAIEELILKGEFSNGDRLDEIKLGERFGVSRTPIREVFQKLTMSGLVEHFPKRGVFVRQPSPIQILEMFEVMAELEAICGRFAAHTISDESIDMLENANNCCQQAIDEKSETDYYRHNTTFHQIIYKESGNSFLEQEALRLQKRLAPFRRIQLHVRGRMKQSMREHKLIVQALVDGDAANAELTLRDHVAIQGKKFQYLLVELEKNSTKT